MGSIRSRNGKLFLDFRYKEKRCREATTLEDTTTNRRRLGSVLKRLKPRLLWEHSFMRNIFPKARALTTSPLRKVRPA